MMGTTWKEQKIFKFADLGKSDVVLDEKYEKFLNYLKNDVRIKPLQEGDIIQGVIKKINDKLLIIDINWKDDITVQQDKMIRDLKLKVGDKVYVLITYNDGVIIKASITEVLKQKIKEKLKECYKNNTPLVGKVIEMIPAGFLLKLDLELNLGSIDHVAIDAFMPNTLAGVNKLTAEQSKDLIEKEINVMVETLDENGLCVVSRRKFLLSHVDDKIKELKKIKREDPYRIFTGTVTGTKDFGIFVEFNECLTGLIHKVNVVPEWRDRIEEIKPGTLIEFYIREIVNNKIILTQIIRDKSIWDNIEKGQIHNAIVEDIKPFGILVKLDEETYGLITSNTNKNVKKGDTLKVKIVSFIREDRKIYLEIV